MIRSSRRVQILLLIFLLGLPVCSTAFVHPSQLTKNKTQIIQEPRQQPRPSDFAFFDLTLASHPMASYVNQDGGIIFHFGYVRPQGISTRIDAGYFTNRDGGGTSIKTIPLMMNLLIGYPLQARIDAYSGAGLGVIVIQDVGSKMGVGYQWFSGVIFGLTPDMSLFSEYSRQYCRLDDQAYDAEMVKFGLTFKFIPR